MNRARYTYSIYSLATKVYFHMSENCIQLSKREEMADIAFKLIELLNKQGINIDKLKGNVNGETRKNFIMLSRVQYQLGKYLFKHNEKMKCLK